MKHKQTQSFEEQLGFYTVGNIQNFQKGQKNSFFQFLQEHPHIKIDSLLYYSEAQLQDINFPPDLYDLLFAVKNKQSDFHQELTELKQSGIHLIPSSSIHYPKTLRAKLINSTLPPILYCKGEIKLLTKEISAILSTQKVSPNKHIQTRLLLENIQNKNLALLCGVGSETDELTFEFAIQHNHPLIIILSRGILANGYLPFELRKPSIPENILIISFFPPYQRSSEKSELSRLKMIHSIAERSYIVDIRRNSVSWKAALQALKDKMKLILVENERQADTHISLYVRGAGLVDSSLQYRYQDSFPTLLNAFLSKEKASLAKIKKHFDLSLSQELLREDLTSLPDIYTEKIGNRIYYRTKNETLDQLQLF